MNHLRPENLKRSRKVGPGFEYAVNRDKQQQIGPGVDQHAAQRNQPGPAHREGQQQAEVDRQQMMVAQGGAQACGVVPHRVVSGVIDGEE